MVFTAASAWCGLSGGAAMLIAVWVMQGVGTGVLPPQALSTITRICPAQCRRYRDEHVRAIAGAVNLLGPLVGGALMTGWAGSG
ncbi:hypothetical protein [Mycobacterium uberis]|uniref:hypothetical protein n=1 Tax=Mycobacterium uberis TaxID=2162698 RepID=UPI000E3087BC|nr:hypothetical protein [Mycobacterium uberis]